MAASAPAPAASPVQDAAAPAAAQPQAPVSLSARKVYEQARSQLVQIRTVLKGQASQTSVGSGFLVTKDGLIVTNFHVVSEAALKPERHELVYVTADGREAPLAILQLDVLHDLALLQGRRCPGQDLRRAAASGPRTGRWPRASASIRSAIRSTSASRSCRAPTTAWSSGASIRRSSSAARSRAA